MSELRRFGQSSNFDPNALLITPIGCAIESFQESAPIKRAYKMNKFALDDTLKEVWQSREVVQ